MAGKTHGQIFNQTRFRPAGGTLSLQHPLPAQGSGQSLRGEGATSGHVSIMQAGVRRGGALRVCARRAAASPAAVAGDEGLRAGAVAPAARRPLRKRQTKDFASRFRCLRCCRLGSSSLAAADPGPPWRQGSVPAPRPRRGFILLSRLRREGCRRRTALH